MKIGKNLKMIRKIFGFTQLDIADKLHVTPQAISRWERDEVVPNMDFMSQLCEIYHMSIDEITNPNLESSSVHDHLLEVKSQPVEPTVIEEEVKIDFGKNIFTRFIKSRHVGFYLMVLAVVLSIVQLIIYSVAFAKGTDNYRYFNPTILVFGSLAIVLGIGLAVTKWTERYSGLAFFAFEVGSFCVFAKYGYMYFSTIFFSGFSWEAFWGMNYGYMGSIVLYILMFILGIACMFVPYSRKATKIVRRTVNEQN